jgi:hypothetical protein
MNRTTSLTISAALLVFMATLGSQCEIGQFPLILDGSPLALAYRVDENAPISGWSRSATVNLQDVANDLNHDIDSIRVFDITIKVDSVSSSTSSSTTFSGAGSVDGHTVYTMTNVPLSAFASEQSILNSSVTGLTYNPSGVAYLLSLFNDVHNLPEVTGTQTLTASGSPLHFTVHVKFYTQVYGTP